MSIPPCFSVIYSLYFTQPIQGLTVAPSLRLAGQYKNYEGGMGCRRHSASERALDVVTAVHIKGVCLRAGITRLTCNCCFGQCKKTKAV